MPIPKRIKISLDNKRAQYAEAKLVDNKKRMASIARRAKKLADKYNIELKPLQLELF